MQTGVGAYVVFLVVGALLLVIDGHLVRRSGGAYLRGVSTDSRVAESINRLVTVLYHLTALGVLALLSTVQIQLTSVVDTVMARLGVLFLVLATVHGITIWILTAIGIRQQEQQLREKLSTRTEQRMTSPDGADAVAK